ncbi:MAG: glycosyltransferase [Gemmatimonadales bacterium]
MSRLAERMLSALGSRGARARYRAWIKRYDTLGPADREALRARAAELTYQPVVSVILPVLDTDEVWLRRAIESVLGQVYPCWELCIADDHSSRPHVRTVLQEYARRDSRIRIAWRTRNGHISAASNSALALATGEFVALLDHDDELAEQALLAVVEELNRHPSAALLYSDEDKIDRRGRRYDPFFKPDWNPDLFYSFNLVTHLAVYRRRVLKEVGGFREGMEGSQDYDITLRVVERISPTAIRHIPQVLYHWRAIPGSVSLAPREKEYAHEAARRAIRAHFERLDIRAQVQPASGNPSLHRVVYPLPAAPPSVSLLLWDAASAELRHRALTSLLETTAYSRLEILVLLEAERAVDLPSCLVQDPRVRAFELGEGRVGLALREALRRARGDVIGLVGSVEPLNRDWLVEMVSHALRPEIGAVGAKLTDAAGAITHAGLVLHPSLAASRVYHGLSRRRALSVPRLAAIQNYSAVTGGCLVARRTILNEVADVTVGAGAFFDVDLCLRIGAAGYRIVWTPHAELRWLDPETWPGAGSSKRQQPETDLLRRWGPVLQEDPNYNPNLARNPEEGGLAWPPRRAPHPTVSPACRERRRMRPALGAARPRC